MWNLETSLPTRSRGLYSPRERPVVPRVARDLDVGVHHLLDELPDHRTQHIRARRGQGLLELGVRNRHNVTWPPRLLRL
jgi:hypothetical protein